MAIKNLEIKKWFISKLLSKYKVNQKKTKKGKV